jgi:hypothetical protein
MQQQKGVTSNRDAFFVSAARLTSPMWGTAMQQHPGRYDLMFYGEGKFAIHPDRSGKAASVRAGGFSFNIVISVVPPSRRPHT